MRALLGTWPRGLGLIIIHIVICTKSCTVFPAINSKQYYGAETEKNNDDIQYTGGCLLIALYRYTIQIKKLETMFPELMYINA